MVKLSPFAVAHARAVTSVNMSCAIIRLRKYINCGTYKQRRHQFALPSDETNVARRRAE